MRVLRSLPVVALFPALGGSLLVRSSAAARLTGRRRGRSTRTLAMAAALPSGKEEQKAFVESAWAGAEVVRPLDNGRVVVVGSSRGIGLEL
mmetsp:Transcript_54114/g.149318  ORF Transcript_54114/g.149318 Transcript_54114/m.149318 type:complete len:91 (-) Transcript_54114:1029-1301(-)